MNVYHLVADGDTFQSFALVDEDRYDWLQDRFDGQTLGSEWSTLQIEFISPEHRPTDYATLAGIPVFSRGAVDALGDLLERHGELLPLVGEDFVMYNVTELPDALDESSSELEYTRSGRVLNINTYVLRPERLTGVAIFKLPQQPRSRVYATDELLDRVRRAGLVGFDRCEMVWSG